MKYDFEAMDFVIDAAKDALLKNREAIGAAFLWNLTPQGDEFWEDFFINGTKEGREALEEMIKEYEMRYEDYREFSKEEKKQTDGGPSKYYDFPFKDWITTNDMMEYLAEHKWGIYSIHLKDVFKGLCRWGDKKGTSEEYDTKKGIYYFCRVLMMIKGKGELREYLQSILDDPQFKE